MQNTFFDSVNLSKITSTILAFLAFGLMFIGLNITVHAEESSLFKLIQDDAQFSLLKEAIQKSGLEQNLSKADGDKITLLAPNNQALEKLPKPVLENILKPENKDSLIKFLNYHLVSGTVNGVQIVSSKTLKTLEGSDLNIKLTSSQILLNEKINLSKIDIKASNGVLHIIDEALIPSSLNIDSLSNGTAQSQPSSSSESPSSSSKSQESTEPSPATTETPRTGANFAVPVVVIIFGLIGSGLRMIVRPVKVKN